MLGGCSGMDDFKKHQQFIEQQVLNNPAISHHHLRSDDFSLHYASAGTPVQGIAVLVHGTPGSWADFGALMLDRSLTEKLMLVSLDRPGWGKSQPIADGQPDVTVSPAVFPEFDQQLQYIKPLIGQLRAEYPGKPIYLLGHSWGASLVLAMAIASPEDYAGILLFAGGLSPELTRPRWYHWLAGRWPVNRLIGEGLRKANREMYALAPSLLKIEQDWHQLERMPAIIIQGEKDSLVSAENAYYAMNRLGISSEKERLPGSSVMVIRDPEYGHLWHIQRPATLGHCLTAMVDRDFQRCAEQINRLQ